MRLQLEIKEKILKKVKIAMLIRIDVKIKINCL